MNELENVILHKAIPIILDILYPDKVKIQSVIAKETNITYSHTCKCLSILQKNNMIENIESEDARIKQIKLTESGKEMAKSLIQLKCLIRGE